MATGRALMATNAPTMPITSASNAVTTAHGPARSEEKRHAKHLKGNEDCAFPKLS